jgi:hypothetical protein
MTRAVQHFLHLEITEAAQYNKLVFIVVPLLVIAWAGEVRRTFKNLRKS